MKALPAIALSLVVFATAATADDDFLDRVDDALTFSALNDEVRGRLSGTIDLEEYHFQQPPPSLIDSSGNNLFNPRLTLSLDAQFGPRVYFFAQSRVDRGFDPTDGGAQVRLDEYALRITPWDDGRFNLQIGKFATVVGNYVQRHLSWENPFVTAPLVYENATPIPYSQPDLGKSHSLGRTPSLSDSQYTPVIWGPNYTTGVSISGGLGKFDYAVELKNASLSSEPAQWNATDGGFTHPTTSARIGYRPNEMWNFGLSASDGSYLYPETAPYLPQGYGVDDYRELVLAQDMSFAWHHWQLWAECYEARFDIPRAGNADTFAYYIEAKYKFAPQIFGALRWNQQCFSTLTTAPGPAETWGPDTWRLDSALAYRFTPRTQLKLQYSLQYDAYGPREFGHLLAAQFTVRF